MDVTAAAKAAAKFGSVVMAAVTVSTIAPRCRPNCNACGGFCGWPCMKRGMASGTAAGCACGSCWSGFTDCVRSRAMVGNADSGAMVEAWGKGCRKPPLPVEPESSMAAAADVVLANALAAGGRGWLWLPS